MSRGTHAVLFQSRVFRRVYFFPFDGLQGRWFEWAESAGQATPPFLGKACLGSCYRCDYDTCRDVFVLFRAHPGYRVGAVAQLLCCTWHTLAAALLSISLIGLMCVRFFRERETLFGLLMGALWVAWPVHPTYGSVWSIKRLSMACVCHREFIPLPPPSPHTNAFFLVNAARFLLCMTAGRDVFAVRRAAASDTAQELRVSPSSVGYCHFF